MEKEFTRYNWQEYKEMLEKYDYTQEQISAVKEIREKYDYMTNDQFRFLFMTGIIKRTRKLKKPRSLYVCEEGKIWYLCHFNKRMEYCGEFVNEEE